MQVQTSVPRCIPHLGKPPAFWNIGDRVGHPQPARFADDKAARLLAAAGRSAPVEFCRGTKRSCGLALAFDPGGAAIAARLMRLDANVLSHHARVLVLQDVAVIHEGVLRRCQPIE